MALLIEVQDRNLLLRSEVTITIPWLFNLIKSHPKVETEHIVSEEQRLFFADKENLRRLRATATTEWVADKDHPFEDRGDDKKDWLKCSLCNEPNRRIYYIENRENGISINVGSTCVQKFWDEEEFIGRTGGILGESKPRWIRFHKFQERYPGKYQIIENWNKALEEFRVLIPSQISERFETFGNNAFQLWEKYLSTGDETILDKIDSIEKRFEEFLEEMRGYETSNLKNPFVVNKDIVWWLKRQERDTVLEILKGTGEISPHTIVDVAEPNFMKSLIPNFNHIFAPEGVKVIGISEGNKAYILVFNSNTTIRMYCTHEKLTDSRKGYGSTLFGREMSVDKVRLLEMCRISPRSIPSSGEELQQILRGHSTRIEFFDSEMNEMDIFDVSSQTYVILNNANEIADLLNRFKPLMLGLPSQKPIDFSSYVSQMTKRRISKMEYTRVRELRSQRR